MPSQTTEPPGTKLHTGTVKPQISQFFRRLLEVQREQEAALAGAKFRPAIEPPYRWRDWAVDPQGITGDELLAFINQDEGIRPDGTRGPGLFAYLRSLTSSNGDDRRTVISTVFKGVDNRMKSGYLLRDVINKISSIHFTSSDELHTLGALYESMLREMRDAAGDSGEFAAARPRREDRAALARLVADWREHVPRSSRDPGAAGSLLHDLSTTRRRSRLGSTSRRRIGSCPEAHGCLRVPRSRLSREFCGLPVRDPAIALAA
jgi:hypothetical protein